MTDTDILVMGGGLAGLTLARQLRMALPNASITVIERGQRPAPEAAYKVGESSVEVAAHYFGERLKLKEHIEADQLPKLGLRFFLPHGDNSEVTKRLEIGQSKYPTVPSYQLDRGRFENHLHDLNLADGVVIYDRARVQAVDLRPGDRHEVKFVHGDEVKTITCRWLVDAAGRNKILKRKQGLEKDSPLSNAAVWFRVGVDIDISDLSDDPEWLGRTGPSRRFSTNHFMGPGYWVWFIPLASGSTSIGIVFDNKMHDFKAVNSFDKAMAWLHQNEPQCAKLIEPHGGKVQDFMGFQDYAHGCKQVYSKDRWCITGEAGVFIDPFYSPGSDLIAYSNDFITELIVKDMRGEDISQLAPTYDRMYLNLTETVLMIYDGLYPKFGNSFVMIQKVLWDSVLYLGVTCLLYFNRKLYDLQFLARVDTELARYNDLMRAVADHFKRQPIKHDSTMAGEYVDMSKIFLYGRNLNKELLIEYSDDDTLIAKLRENLALLEELSKSVFKNEDIVAASWKSMPVPLAERGNGEVFDEAAMASK
ncbi:NAD(P)/FAD-dependent oxidoreductase [Janthinobacterium lividum]|uniref:NAD(P)/FAD-dependent oxidoreductase n=1 Tax=Janthinobacterium lividum TaxID=29581 RepID=UPI000893ABB3|nr:NAD(P)/FAD-dependent oxidoreductase [Janthinobacterium lividum]MCC7716665.1 NAD(P)/FAD-dependent oxidoreductase [Janthinobacterium lividum]OEZ64525.1 tryptophan halogenase [Janthinobacterium lividum]WQE32007.1 NAD(P)/FAD-dependent oxidoreductase [Janthinobacterium lividum]STS86006.1 geranylgeranyl reductase family [Janthinobacterium lividum]